MYNKSQIQDFQKITIDFLKNPHKIELETLKTVLKFHPTNIRIK